MKKIGELGVALGWISVVRMAAPFWNVALLENFGPFGVFMGCLMFFATAFLLEICGKETLIPHYSYLISKQKEMLALGVTNKDLDLLQSDEQ